MQRDLQHLIHHNPAAPATVIAYPVNSPQHNLNIIKNNQMDENNLYTSSLGDSNFADDTIEMSGNFFSQVMDQMCSNCHLICR